MYTKHSKGFTLVETLIVVVILGVLAAIAVPSLVGSIGKAKASEVTVAAGTYTKLQNVSIGEKGKVGNWKNIGYIAPGNDGKSKHFLYSEGQLTDDLISIEDLGAGLIGWQATNITLVGTCTSNHWWLVVLSMLSEHEAFFDYQVNGKGCAAVAQNFHQGDKAGVGGNGGSANGNLANGTSGEGSNGEASATNANTNLASNAGFQTGSWRGNGDNIKDDKTSPVGNGMINQSTGNINNTRRGTWNNAEDAENGLYKLEPNQTYTFTIPVGTDLSNYKAGALVYGDATGYSGALNDSGWYTATKANEKPVTSKNKDATVTYATFDNENKAIVMTIKTGSQQEAYYFAANVANKAGNTLSKEQVKVIEAALQNVTLTKVEEEKD